MRDKHLIPLLCFLLRAVIVILKHLAQTTRGKIPPEFIQEGIELYEHARWLPDGDGDQWQL